MLAVIVSSCSSESEILQPQEWSLDAKIRNMQGMTPSATKVSYSTSSNVNQEFEVLYAFLNILPEAVSSGGRIAILTFHSGEDKLVKKAFKEGLRSGVYSRIAEDVIRPSAEECARNPRARSTKLRWAVRA